MTGTNKGRIVAAMVPAYPQRKNIDLFMILFSTAFVNQEAIAFQGMVPSVYHCLKFETSPIKVGNRQPCNTVGERKAEGSAAAEAAHVQMTSQ